MNIKIQDLTKVYPDGHKALNGLNLNIEPGMFGFFSAPYPTVTRNRHFSAPDKTVSRVSTRTVLSGINSS